MHPRELLTTPIAYLAPAKVLEGLSVVDAERRQDPRSHSIAEIVAHLSFWQSWFQARCSGRDEPMVQSASLGWPQVPAGTWPEVEERFVSGLEALVELAGNTPGDRRLSPAIPFPPLAEYTVGDALVHVATHNAHHLGQVVILRQLQGTWPPPSGSWTW